MYKDILDFVKLIADLATISVVFIAIFTLRENVESRKTSIRPLLIPGRINDFFSDDNLFACNYEYPIAEEIGTRSLVHLVLEMLARDQQRM